MNEPTATRDSWVDGLMNENEKLRAIIRLFQVGDPQAAGKAIRAIGPPPAQPRDAVRDPDED